MDLEGTADSASRFAAFVGELVSVIGHADRARPLRDYCTGLLASRGPQKRGTDRSGKCARRFKRACVMFCDAVQLMLRTPFRWRYRPAEGAYHLPRQML